MISKNGIRPTENKVEAIHGTKAPSLNVSELQSFIVLANYLRSFVSKFAELVAPLYHLLKKNWQTDHQPLTKICNEHECIPQLTSNRGKTVVKMRLKAYNFNIPGN